MSTQARYVIVAVVVAVSLLAAAKEAKAVTCSPLQLTPCLSAFSSGAQPSPACCTAMRDQRPCLCQYYRNPSFSQYVKSPAAKKVASACQVTVQC